MSYRYFTVLSLLLYFYCVYDDHIFIITYDEFILLNILTLICIVSYNSMKNDLIYFNTCRCDCVHLSFTLFRERSVSVAGMLVYLADLILTLLYIYVCYIVYIKMRL